ncbi:hypothetical protein [Streptomyces sp. MBT62]|uniref:hypothetical protein n=1 Tax=Streptomyces sp. MBT62 TaxID=2800410 RepID=UPI00190A4758|nr:hypothetical protein [Streptomyces sp. MBT62]MBK3570045.1 hypothetical protein [Streptomyces sp. MBT62]
MSETTGTIIASVIAFISAVIGAVIAGIYAKRGAEVGGRKAVEAALAQVHGQAAVEHWQWVRSQRHQSFAALLAAYATLDEVLTRIAPEVRNGARLGEASGRELRQGALALQDKTSQLALWGPHEASELAYALMRKATDTVGALLQVAVVGSMDRNAGWVSFERARNEMVTAYAGFLQRAGEVIRDPLQPVS